MTEAQQQYRKRLIGRIHAEAAARGIDDALRRVVQRDEVGKASSAKMTISELQRVVWRLTMKGRRPESGEPSAEGRGQKFEQTDDPGLRFLLGVARDLGLGEAYLNGVARRATGAGHWRWLRGRDLSLVIDALAGIARRRGRQDVVDRIAETRANSRR